MLGPRPASAGEIRQAGMLVEIVDGAVDRAPKLIDRGDGPQAVAPEVEEIVLAGDGLAFEAVRPYLRDALFHALAGLGAPTVDAARFGGVGSPLGNHAQQRRPIHLAGGVHRDGRHPEHGRGQHAGGQRTRQVIVPCRLAGLGRPGLKADESPQGLHAARLGFTTAPPCRTPGWAPSRCSISPSSTRCPRSFTCPSERPRICSSPEWVQRPRSPVEYSRPAGVSTKLAAVRSGRFRYPEASPMPPSHMHPTASGGTGSPWLSRIWTDVLANGLPAVSRLAWASWAVICSKLTAAVFSVGP